MLKNGTRKILLVAFALSIIVIAFASNTYAGSIDIMRPTGNNTLNQATDASNIPSINGVGVQNNTTNTATNNFTAPVVSNNTINNTKNNISTYTNTDLPKTGVEDYPIIILMAVCVIAAIYAHFKIRNYNSL